MTAADSGALEMSTAGSTIAQSGAGQFSAVLIGLGRAGLGLHAPILQKMKAAGNPHFAGISGIIDTTDDAVERAKQRLKLEFKYNPATLAAGTSLDALSGLDRESTVVHICTPASDHLPTFEKVVGLGFKHIILEKPCAGNLKDVDAMQRIADKTGVSPAIVNPYLYSRTVLACKSKVVENGEKPHYLEFELSKPRKAPTLKGRSTPESVIDVELPHQIAAALHIIAPKSYRVLRAVARHMHYRANDNDACTIVSNMGLGVLVLELDQTVVTLISYLDATARTRTLQLRFPSHDIIECKFPVSEEDHTSEIFLYSGQNSDGTVEQQASQKLPDDLFTRCLEDIYAKFASGQPHLSDIAFNRKVVEIMDEAKRMTALRR